MPNQKIQLNPVVALLFSFLSFYPISDMNTADFYGMLPHYRAECLVPFKSMCLRPRTEMKTLLDKKAAAEKKFDLSSSTAQAMQNFIPIVIERPYLSMIGNSDTEKSREVHVDLIKIALLDSFLPEQMMAHNRTDIESQAETIAKLYVSGELTDCCQYRRPRVIPLSVTGRQEFNLWGLSSQHSCYRNVCPLEYSFEKSTSEISNSNSDSQAEGGHEGHESQENGESDTSNILVLKDSGNDSSQDWTTGKPWTQREERNFVP